ncbi:hypothetical protein M0811_10255 [Anaeramoeba ignava]|uniref:Uncharacterized protein n=1 Tax=Anaeramoeba ignava TaxID=1746090 RepID=A0A9Q0R8U1_ANAIG|nr:hypothetical protein M0811_10255 [Anaeramoeba ignava]
MDDTQLQTGNKVFGANKPFEILEKGIQILIQDVEKFIENTTQDFEMKDVKDFIPEKTVHDKVENVSKNVEKIVTFLKDYLSFIGNARKDIEFGATSVFGMKEAIIQMISILRKESDETDKKLENLFSQSQELKWDDLQSKIDGLNQKELEIQQKFIELKKKELLLKQKEQILEEKQIHLEQTHSKQEMLSVFLEKWDKELKTGNKNVKRSPKSQTQTPKTRSNLKKDQHLKN